jgi:dTDP-glucose 4,6-dehydratase
MLSLTYARHPVLPHIRPVHIPDGDGMSARRLLVTGGAGFIGSNFVRYWAGLNDDPIVVLDALTYAGNFANIADLVAVGRVHFVHGRIEDQSGVEGLLHDHNLDTIVHFAAESHVDRSIRGPDAFVETNVIGTHALLKAALSAWGSRPNGMSGCLFHHVSTDEVYGELGITDPPFTETTPYAPNSPYAATKAASDHLVRAYHRTYGLPVTTTNCSNNYGPFHFPEKLIPLLIVNALAGRDLPIYGDGMNIRDWLFVEDHCSAIWHVMSRGQRGETYNVGGGSERTNRDVVAAICCNVDVLLRNDQQLKARFPDAPAARGIPTETLVRFVADRPGHDRRYAIDATKIASELNVRASRSFESGLLQTIRWYIDNEPWWRRILTGRYHDWIAQHYKTESS